MPKSPSRFTQALKGLFTSPSPADELAEKRRNAEAQLAIRTQQFQDARRAASVLQADYQAHAAAGDWSAELLQIQLANSRRELRKADLLFRQVKVLQENLQILSTAALGGDLVGDAAPLVEGDALKSIDRAYWQTQAHRQEVAQVERELADSLLEEVPEPQLDALPPEPARERIRTMES